MLKLIIKKTSYCLVLLLFFTISCITQAAIQKSYPPYPDVWGYDLSEFPAMKWGLAGVTPYAMDDGDIWFVVTYSYKKTNPMDSFAPFTDYKYVLIKFFKGEQSILNAQEREKLFKITEGKKIFLGYLHDNDIDFSDGSKLSIHQGSMTKRCFVPDFMRNYIVKIDAQGKEKKYSILGAATQVSIHQSDVDCVAEENSPFFYQKLHTLTEFIPLKDDTFIVLSTSEPNIILRFDKDFKTKFKPATPVTIHGSDIMRNFFVIDYALIEELYAQFTGKSDQVYQRIHDALLTHFQEQYLHK
jgi:hypothetical protein